MNTDSPHCVIVGAGHAAAQLCASLVKASWQGRITLIGDEPTHPYHRPPLSKTQLDAESAAALLLIRPESFYTENGIEFVPGCRVASIDRQTRTVRSDRHKFDYDQLVLSTGSIPLRPPIKGIDHPRVFTLYQAQHAQRIREALSGARRVAIVGAGFIGLEVASSLSKMGLEVTVLELADRILSRVTCPDVSDWFENLHRRHGVDLQTGTMASSIDDRGDELVVVTSDGREFQADFIVVGTGVEPNVELAEEAGLEIDNGVVVDEFNRTSEATIYAMGDCCNQFSPLYDRRLRLESVQNASDQAKTVAAAIAGKPTPHSAMPWFWSDQYDVKFQIAGISSGYDSHIVRKSPQQDESFSVWYFTNDRLVAVDAINDPRSYMAASRIIPDRGCPDPNLVSDPNSDLKAIMQSAKERADVD